MKTNISVLSILSLLLLGCNEIPQIPQPQVPHNKSNFITPKDNNFTKPIEQNITKEKPKYKKQTIPKAPKKDIKLKKVEDNNFSPDYMYPTVTAKKKTTTTPLANKSIPSSITKEECISMIGQDRFDRYVKMLGSQDSAIKRCQMIKAQS